MRCAIPCDWIALSEQALTEQAALSFIACETQLISFALYLFSKRPVCEWVGAISVSPLFVAPAVHSGGPAFPNVTPFSHLDAFDSMNIGCNMIASEGCVGRVVITLSRKEHTKKTHHPTCDRRQEPSITFLRLSEEQLDDDDHRVKNDQQACV